MDWMFCSLMVHFTRNSPSDIIFISTSVPSDWSCSTVFSDCTVPAISALTVALSMVFCSFSSSIFLVLMSYSDLAISVCSDWICVV